jgi:hypothetical protein
MIDTVGADPFENGYEPKFVERLYRERIKSQADRIEKLEAALRSIAANACCDSCREAALVARKALEGKDD